MSVALVTGATDGLGRAVARELTAQGVTVLLHGRDADRLAEAREDTGAARTYRADLASLGEVRALAEEVLAGEERLDVLVSNAGIGTTAPGEGHRLESADGFELRFAVNYLAGFLLTRLLLPRLAASAPARIVHVSSAGQAPIDWDDVMLERSYSGVQAYCQSKLAQVMLTFDLAQELGDRDVSATCLHPATYMPTKMVTGAGVEPVSTLESGTHATVRLAAAPGLDGVTGRYFNGEREARANAQAYDEAARARLRALSSELTGLS